jgi:hypothetical protein
MDERLDYFRTPDVNLLHYTNSTTHIPVTISGNSGMAVDFTGITEEKNVAISGRDVVANLPDGRYLYFSGNWPTSKNDTYLPVFESLLNSLKFYEPIAPTPKP